MLPPMGGGTGMEPTGLGAIELEGCRHRLITDEYITLEAQCTGLIVSQIGAVCH